MITIHKYQFQIADRFIIQMPQGAKVLSIQVQNGIPTIWAMVVSEMKMISREFRVYGTGHPVDTFAIQGNHLATLQHHGFVWHIFENAAGATSGNSNMNINYDPGTKQETTEQPVEATPTAPAESAEEGTTEG